MFKYRPEIDGLRAIAVIPVLFFHAGNPLFAGGFIGVDVFFTISGYLITSIILSEQHKGIFSLKSFYSRRAKRILPPLFVMLLSISAIVSLFPGSDITLDAWRSLSHIALFTSNIYFYKQGGYFETATELKPFFHTWSLAVEEQFYVIFPLLLMAVKTWRRPLLLVFLFVLSLASLVYAQWNIADSPDWTYYMLPTRAWELLAGAMIAVLLLKRPKPVVNPLLSEFASFMGLTMILLSMIFITSKTPHPSVYTLVPILGSAFIIATSNNSVWFRQILGSRIMVGIGLISYSLYLWHQPLFALYRVHIQAVIPLGAQLFLMALSFLFALISWKWIEQPTRHSRWPDKKILLTALCASLGFFILGRIGKHTRGLEFLLPEETRKLHAFKFYERKQIYRESLCFLEPHQSADSFARDCQAKVADKNSHILLWGDSHAASLYHGLHKEWPHALSQFTASNCPPLLDVEIDHRPHCREINAHVFKVISTSQPRAVILNANWSAHFGSLDASLLLTTLKKLNALPFRPQVLVVGGLPQWMPSLVDVIKTHHLPFKEGIYVPSSELQSIAEADVKLQAFTSRFSNVQFLSPVRIACEKEACLATVTFNNQLEVMAWDSAHLTANGSLWWAQKILSSWQP